MRDTVKHTTLKGAHYLTVTPDGRKAFHQLAVNFENGEGVKHGPADRAQANIWIDGKQIFTGTFEELQSTIKTGHQMENEGIIINGYKIIYNSYWKTYQASHTTSDEVSQEDYNTLQDAINYAING